MKEYIDFALQLGELKRLRRSGWKRKGIENGETVAEHIFRSDILAFTLPREIEVNRVKLLQLMLVHDLAESDQNVGDIMPCDDVPNEEKFEREKSAMEKLCANIDNGDLIFALWMEYEAGETVESKIAHDIDKLEMAIQALDYERTHNIDLSEFFEDAHFRIKHPLVIELLQEVCKRRKPRLD